MLGGVFKVYVSSLNIFIGLMQRETTKVLLKLDFKTVLAAVLLKENSMESFH